MRPFEEPESNFTLVNNQIFDLIMHQVSPVDFVILMTIFRKTRGWNKQFDHISYTQIQGLTGIGSTATISESLKRLHEGKLIVIQKVDGKTSLYGLNSHYETVSEIEVDPFKNQRGTTSETEGVPLQKLKTQKKELKKREIQLSKEISPFTEKLSQITGMDPNLKSTTLNRVAQSLLDNGYTIEDLDAFWELWKTDWRYKKDKALPSWRTVLSEIGKVKTDTMGKKENGKFNDWIQK